MSLVHLTAVTYVAHCDDLCRTATPAELSGASLTADICVVGQLDRRIPDEAILKAEITAWNRDRNAAATTIDWRFTTADARIKLKHLIRQSTRDYLVAHLAELNVVRPRHVGFLQLASVV